MFVEVVEVGRSERACVRVERSRSLRHRRRRPLACVACGRERSAVTEEGTCGAANGATLHSARVADASSRGRAWRWRRARLEAALASGASERRQCSPCQDLLAPPLRRRCPYPTPPEAALASGELDADELMARRATTRHRRAAVARRRETGSMHE